MPIRYLCGLALAGCGGTGVWQVEVWGEEYIEQGIPSSEFADACSVEFSRALVAATDAALLDGDADVAAALAGGPFALDLTQPGPTPFGEVDAPSGPYDAARFRIAPAASFSGGNAADGDRGDLAGHSLLFAGTLTCGAQEVAFSWTFDTETTYLCEPDGLVIPAGGADGTQLTIHGDHLFYDALEDPDAQVRGEAIVAADADSDGVVTQVELGAVSVATLGYDVGRFADVEDLGAFIAHLTGGVGHVDGEGHCAVSTD